MNTSKPKPKAKLVKVTDLNTDMLILAYEVFGKKYRSLSKLTCEWLKFNFKGTQAIVERDGQKIEVAIGQLETGDNLRRLYKFPASLKKLTIVNKRLATELKARGFHGFIVRKIVRKPSTKQLQRRQEIGRTKAFVQKVEENIEFRDTAVNAVEDLMDNTRNGNVNILELMNCIDNITEAASADALGAIAGLKKSDQTYTHCVDVGAIFQTAYTRIVEKKGISSPFRDEQDILLGAFMHDFGKSKLPKEILDSTALFDKNGPEMEMMRKHPQFSAELLTKIRMPDHVVNMAQYHHVKIDTSLTSSYPEVDSYDKLSMETRLIAVVDIYQALVGRRSYKKSWAPPAAMSFIGQLADAEYDVEIWKDFFQAMGRYPAGSLVQLSDGTQAFVTSVPEIDLNRPQVVVVRNAKGQDLKNQTFVDLQEEKDLSIVKGLDNDEVFGDDSLSIFTNLRIS
ncbi:MAG: HD domain-containing protein [Proteobacteria bacterium]|nr:HD domain-containing protein [Pseudomonadota bacterium]